MHVSVWSMWTGDEEQSFQRVLDAYQRAHPGIVLDNLGAVRDDAKTVRAIVAGAPPDLFTLADANQLGPIAANGGVMPLDDRFHAAGLKDADFVPASLEQCRYRGKLYAMPYLIDDQALFWNKMLFREAGLDPERPPATLDELADMAVKLTKRDASGAITQLGIAPMGSRTFFAGDIYLLFQIFGGKLYDAQTGRVTPDDPANVAALEWYAGLIRRLGGARQVSAFAAGFGEPQGANNPFFMGKIALMVNGEWNPYWAAKFAPDLDYGVAPMPGVQGFRGSGVQEAGIGQGQRQRTEARSPEALKPATWCGGNMFCIPRGSRHAKEAWDFLVWMQSDEAQILFATAMNNVPNRRSALRAPELRTGAPYRQKFAIFLDLAQTPRAGVFPALPITSLYTSELANAFDFTLDGSKPPRQALADVRVRVQREMDRY